MLRQVTKFRGPPASRQILWACYERRRTRTQLAGEERGILVASAQGNVYALAEQVHTRIVEFKLEAHTRIGRDEAGEGIGRKPFEEVHWHGHSHATSDFIGDLGDLPRSAHQRINLIRRFRKEISARIRQHQPSRGALHQPGSKSDFQRLYATACRAGWHAQTPSRFGKAACPDDVDEQGNVIEIHRYSGTRFQLLTIVHESISLCRIFLQPGFSYIGSKRSPALDINSGARHDKRFRNHRQHP